MEEPPTGEHRILEWFGLEGPLKIIQFHASAGTLSRDTFPLQALSRAEGARGAQPGQEEAQRGPSHSPQLILKKGGQALEGATQGSGGVISGGI